VLAKKSAPPQKVTAIVKEAVIDESRAATANNQKTPKVEIDTKVVTK
jgi:hypothetical protein